MKFTSLNLHKDILKGIEDIGYERCTPVQEQSLPESLEGKDIISQAQTGTGKTAVFLLTILNKLSLREKEPGVPSALIVVPTRELAEQVDSDAKKFAKHLKYRSLAVYGGVGYEKQEAALKEGVDIIAATPGRLIDLYKSGTLSLKEIDQFVIDEADRMFDMGFIPDIRYIAKQLPKNIERQTMLFSATISSEVYRLALNYMRGEPVMIEVEPEQITVDSIEQKLVYVSNEEKFSVLMALLKRPETTNVIIFTNMKITAEEVGWKLTRNGFPASVLTGDISQSKRRNVINMMKSGEINILVATDVAARGLHIDNITHVINYDLPNEAATYVHRIGRTARAGKSGMAYSLVCEDHALNLIDIEKYIERKIDKEWIDESEMIKDEAGPFRRRSGGKTDKSRVRKTQGKKKSVSPSKNKKISAKKIPHETETAQKSVMKSNNTKKKMVSRKKPPKGIEDRLNYYKNKYGENFSTPNAKPTGKEDVKKTDVKPRISSKAKRIDKNDVIKPARKFKNKNESGVFNRLLRVFGKK